MENKTYSIVDLETGERFGNYTSLSLAKSKAYYYATNFRSKVAVIDNLNNVVIGYSTTGKEIQPVIK